MKQFRILIIALLLPMPSLALPASSISYEHELLHALETLLTYDNESAVIQLEKLTLSYPDSRTAHLLYADLLAA